MNQIHKYPRTPHINGSRLQAGDEDLAQIQFAELAGQYVVVEEKLDGANSAISFDEEGKLWLQSRGHYLSGGPGERQFDLFKAWANAHIPALHGVLGARYVMYGEWMYAKHTIYYNALPDYFIEFDILDREQSSFLSTAQRQKLLEKLEFVHSAPILFQGELKQKSQLAKLIGPSSFIKGSHIAELREQVAKEGDDPEKVIIETDPSRTMEGLYIKIESPNKVEGRYKWVCNSFSQVVESSGSHWKSRKTRKNVVS